MISDNSQVELRALVPPEFNAHCSKCGLLKKLLPWQISTASHWGPCCAACGKTILLGVLRRQLRSPFSETELMNVLWGLGMEKKLAFFLFQDLQKEGIFWKTEKGFQWFEPLVIPISGLAARRARKRAYRRLSSEEIFLKCVKLAREIRTVEGD